MFTLLLVIGLCGAVNAVVTVTIPGTNINAVARNGAGASGNSGGIGSGAGAGNGGAGAAVKKLTVQVVELGLDTAAQVPELETVQT